MRRSWIFAGILGTIMVMILTTVFVLYGTEILVVQWIYFGLLVIAAMMSPLLAPALLTLQEETRVRRRDDAFPEFIRAFGGTAQARAQEPSAMVKALSGIDFGALDDSISNLEKRLSMRIDSDYSWDWLQPTTIQCSCPGSRGYSSRIFFTGEAGWLETWSPRVQPVC